MVLDNYLVFGAPQESGAFGGAGEGRVEGWRGWAATSLAVFIIHSANTTLQHLAGGNASSKINGLLSPPEKGKRKKMHFSFAFLPLIFHAA